MHREKNQELKTKKKIKTTYKITNREKRQDGEAEPGDDSSTGERQQTT